MEFVESDILGPVRAGPYSAVLGRIPQYLWYVSLCLFVRRNAAKLLDGSGTSVVGGQGQALVTAELPEQTAQELRASLQALGRIGRIGHAQAARGGGHQLRQASRSRWRLRIRIKIGFLLDQARQQRRIDAV